MKKKSYYNNKIIYGVFIFYFLLGLSTYKDYGINIEEHLHRYFGFFWLDYILSFTNFDILHDNVKNILNSSFDPYLPNIKTYGVVFDVPLALIETVLNISSTKLYFETRHLLTFILFFLSAICFYKIIEHRFKKLNITIFSTLAYIITPRIYGDSFHNNKDILFLSLLTITIYFLFKFFKDSNYKYLSLFSFFLALSTSVRIMAIFIPVFFIITHFLAEKNKNIFMLKTIIFFLLYIFFLVIFWPYLWSGPIENLIFFLKNLRGIDPIPILYDGKYYYTTQMPDLYLLKWIAISTPVVFLLLFVFGAGASFKRLWLRVLKLKEKTFYRDLWRGVNEQKDFFCLISFVSILFFVSTFSLAFISGWRHFYFLHFFSSYFIAYSIYLLSFLYKKKIRMINFIGFLTIIFIINDLIKFHPYESLYFNIIGRNSSSEYQVDMASLSRSEALKLILQDAKKDAKEKVYVATASFTPLYNGLDMLTEKNKKYFSFVGNEYDKADYIYTNKIYEVDVNYNKKYIIPDNFFLFNQLTIDKVKIYEIYKKK